MSKTDLAKFLGLLFRPGESTCFTDTPYGTSVFSVAQLIRYGIGTCQFFSINPLRTYRLDSDVLGFRNFLLELDNGPKEEQLAYIEGLGVPWTTCVDSGGKSLHFIISLKDDIKTEAAYRELASRIHAVVLEADHHTKNPSRLSRLPTAMRHETGRVQGLVEMRSSIKQAELETWLAQFPASATAPVMERSPSAINLSAQTIEFLYVGAPEGERNHSLFKAACEFFRAGFTQTQAREYLEMGFNLFAGGMTVTEFERTFVSAYRRAEDDLRRIKENT